MAKKFKLNKKTLKALFDYNLFSPNQRLEQLTQDSLERTGADLEPLKMPDQLEMGALEMLSAAGDPSKGDLPHSPKFH